MARRLRGIFITFEGVDGSGKTTQIRLLTQYLRRRGLPFVVTREPGGTRIADRIREILLSRRSRGMTPETEVLLYFAARGENVARVIRPALEQGKIVVSDRFTDASIAYQGFGRRLGTEIVNRLHRFVCGSIKPDLTLILEIETAAGVKRARRRISKDKSDEGRIEQETRAFYRRVRKGYRELARREPRRVRVIDGEAPPRKVHEAVVKTVAPLLRRYRPEGKR